MTAMIEYLQPGLGVAERPLVGLRGAHRHQRILAAPDDLRRQAAYALQKVRQTPIVKNRLPGDARDFGARVLEGLELLRSPLAAIERGELRRALRIVYAQVERRALG